MCGIFVSIGQEWTDSMTLALSSLNHRGPDSSNFFYDPETLVFLGHTRLAIQDLSSKAAQPMADCSDRFVITFNGEIYNAKSLRRLLRAKGVQLKTMSDTEALLEAFVHFGKKILSRLDGMFAFVIYDKKLKRVTIVRDSFGVKPLYYNQGEGTINFASEIGAIQKFNHRCREVDEAAIKDLFEFGSVGQPKSIFKSVRSLMPGCVIDIDLKKDTVPIYSRYSFKIRKKREETPYQRLVQKTKIIVTSSIKRALVSDVPIGVFLSGGLDSAVVAAVAQKTCEKKVHALTVAFEGCQETKDESDSAAITARALGLEHTVESINLSDINNLFNDYIIALDQPTFEGFNSFLVSRAASKTGLKVFLSGQGADELFGGYNHFKYAVDDTLRTLPRWLKKMVYLTHRIRTNRFARIAEFELFDAEDVVSNIRRIDGVNLPHNKEKTSKSEDVGTRISKHEICNYLPNTLLRDLDDMSMHFSIEVRPVFLVREVAELALNLPKNIFQRGHLGKQLLRDAFEEDIPTSILIGKKYGFELPYLSWMNGPLNDLFNELVVRNINSHSGLDFLKVVELESRIKAKKCLRKDWMSLVWLAWASHHGLEF